MERVIAALGAEVAELLRAAFVFGKRDDSRLITALCIATRFAPANASAFPNAGATFDWWVRHFAAFHDALVTQIVADAAEEDPEIVAQLDEAVAAAVKLEPGSALPTAASSSAELAWKRVFRAAAAESGDRVLTRAAPSTLEAFAADGLARCAAASGGADRALAAATTAFRRCWASLSLPSQWYLEPSLRESYLSAAAPAALSTPLAKPRADVDQVATLHAIHYRVEPAAVRYVYSHVPFVAAQVSAATRSSGRLVRHVTLDVEESLLPTGPVLNAVKSHAANASFAGVEESDLQRHLAKLQRLLRGETAEALGGSSTAAGVIKKGPQPSSGVGATASAAPSISALYRDPEAALKDADLQNADDATVKEYKEKMNEGFSKNVLKPGDAGYEYDRRVEFKPVAKSKWDESDDD